MYRFLFLKTSREFIFEIKIKHHKNLCFKLRKPLILFTVETVKELNTVPETKARQEMYIIIFPPPPPPPSPPEKKNNGDISFLF